jgi:hypothetical protein
MYAKGARCSEVSLSEIGEIVTTAMGYTQWIPLKPNEHELNIAFLQGSQIVRLAHVDDLPHVEFDPNAGYRCPTLGSEFSTELPSDFVAYIVRLSGGVVLLAPMRTALYEWTDREGLHSFYMFENFQVISPVGFAGSNTSSHSTQPSE